MNDKKLEFKNWCIARKMKGYYGYLCIGKQLELFGKPIEDIKALKENLKSQCANLEIGSKQYRGIKNKISVVTNYVEFMDPGSSERRLKGLDAFGKVKTETELNKTNISSENITNMLITNERIGDLHAREIAEQYQLCTKKVDSHLKKINDLMSKHVEQISVLVKEFAETVNEMNGLFMAAELQHQEALEKKPSVQVIGKINLSPKPAYQKSNETIEHRTREIANTIKDFRITRVSARRAGSPGQFYEAVDSSGKPFSLLGYDELTMLNPGESIRVSSVEKISKDGKNIYHVIFPLTESDGQEF